jgi:transcriptional regulator with XRE-family HTH domain
VLKDTILGKEIGQILTKVREKSGLSQIEVAERIGLSKKNGQGYISRLEKGKTKNPPIQTILFYLRACGESWPEFFKQLDTIDFKLRHEKMIAQVHPPPTERKIQRDAMKYEIGVEFPSKEKEEIDFDRLKKQIKDKVTALVNKEDITLTSVLSHRGRGGNAVIADYQKFALEYFEFLATLNKAGMKMVADKYQRAGLKLNLIFKIKKIVNSVLRGEIKRIEAKKPLPTEKQEKMAIGFTKYRIINERIEAEVHKGLCELGVPTPWFSLYKDFSRQCYRALKQYYGKEPEKLKERLSEFVRQWQKRGLQENVLLKVKEKTLFVYTGRN